MSELPTMRVKPWGDEQGDHVVINTCDFDPAKYEAIDPPPVTAPAGFVPPPPPDPADALSKLPADWKTKDTVELKAYAAAISGRSVENGKQAVEVIEAALAAKK